MTIDKQKLQSLLWSEVAAWKADCAEWKRNTEALQEFLGEKTVEEVALELLAENERLKAECETFAETTMGQEALLAEVIKNAERYEWLRHGHSGHIEVVEWIGPHATGMIGENLDALVDAAMAKAVQP